MLEGGIKIAVHLLYSEKQQLRRSDSKIQEMQRHLLLAQAGRDQDTGVSAPSQEKLLKSSLTTYIPATHSFISNDTSIKWTGMPNSYLLQLFLSEKL